MYSNLMSTPNRMQVYWSQVKFFIKKEWPKLSDSAVNNINGDFDKFLEYLKETYNNFPYEEAVALNKINNFINSIEERA